MSWREDSRTGDFWKFGLIFGLIYFAGLLLIVLPWRRWVG
jgi:di/tricarboxylate transporter